MKEFKVTTIHELWTARIRPHSMGIDKSATQCEAETVAKGSVQKAEAQERPKAVQKKIKSASTASVKNGVYIQDINGKLWKTEDWNGSVQPNAIAVITPEHKFRIALQYSPSRMTMNPNSTDPWETYLSGTTNSGITDGTVAKTDYSGAVNTQLIVEKCQSSTEYAAGACNAYTFPDGVTKGYLPALGELNLAYQNKAAIDAALLKCGGTAMAIGCYWSSTFYGSYNGYRYCWILSWSDGYYSYLINNNYVRPFASLD